uniref:AlNc14C4G563 protein n=1 Tax=Albugo laibachii Nc14 TaxID=890382 RepID=F0W0C0_9STRA|nr:AlNc14C4G563 [Albugo laibachii Nc14]|eukprot:CCA14492.1 AlNc14C4G563 [Albugo laibachii Nc14]
MGTLYFSAPVVAGCYVMQWTQRKAEENLDLQARQSEISRPMNRSVKAQNDQLRKVIKEKNQ